MLSITLFLAISFAQMADATCTVDTLEQFPFEDASNAVLTHNGSIIMIPTSAADNYYNDTYEHGIYAYKSDAKWKNIFRTDELASPHVHITPTHKTNEFLIITSSAIYAFSYDETAETRSELVILNSTNEFDRKYEGTISTMVNSELQLLFGQFTNAHTTYNKYSFSNVTSLKDYNSLCGHNVIVDKDGMSMFGGCTYNGNEWKCINKTYNYCDGSWCEDSILLPMSMAYFGALKVQISKRKYFLITFGGTTEEEGDINNIFVYDSQLNYWGLSNVQLPIKARYDAILKRNELGNDLLGGGYCRQDLTQLYMSFPYYLLNIIVQYNGKMDYVHVLAGTGEHYGISLDAILEDYDEHIDNYLKPELVSKIEYKTTYVNLNYKSRYLHSNRHKYLGLWDANYIQMYSEKIGKDFTRCTFCGKISDDYSEHYNHLTLKHFTTPLNEQELANMISNHKAINGEYYLYAAVDVAGVEKYECLGKGCPKVYGAKSTAMGHGQKKHYNLYKKLL